MHSAHRPTAADIPASSSAWVAEGTMLLVSAAEGAAELVSRLRRALGDLDWACDLTSATRYLESRHYQMVLVDSTLLRAHPEAAEDLLPLCEESRFWSLELGRPLPEWLLKELGV